MKNNFQKRSGRLINIYGKLWKYRVGKGYVVAYSEDGLRLCSPLWIVKGLNDPYIFERGQNKNTSDGSILPSDIRKWILCK